MMYQDIYNCICQNTKKQDILSIMSHLQPNCCLKIDFQKVDQHARGKWLIHDTKSRKDNQLHHILASMTCSPRWLTIQPRKCICLCLYCHKPISTSVFNENTDISVSCDMKNLIRHMANRRYMRIIRDNYQSILHHETPMSEINAKKFPRTSRKLLFKKIPTWLYKGYTFLFEKENGERTKNWWLSARL